MKTEEYVKYWRNNIGPPDNHPQQYDATISISFPIPVDKIVYKIPMHASVKWDPKIQHYTFQPFNPATQEDLELSFPREVYDHIHLTLQQEFGIVVTLGLHNREDMVRQSTSKPDGTTVQ